MTLISREELTRAIPATVERVELPEFGEDKHVYVKGLTVNERTKYESSVQGKGRMTAREKLLIRTVVDESGTPILTGDDVLALSAQSAAVVERLIDKAMELSGMKTDEVDRAGN